MSALRVVACLLLLLCVVPDGRSARADDAASSIVLRAVGDIAIAGTMRDEMLANALDPFAATSASIRSADIAFANLEAVLTERRAPPGTDPSPTGPLLRSPARTATLMHDAGFDVVSLANNHVFDFGAGGLEDTVAHVRAAGLEPLGAGSTAEDARREVTFDVRGTRIAFLGFTEMTNEHLSTTGFVGRLENAVARVREVRSRVDVLVVSLHWGVQFTSRPRPWQRRLAHALLDAGADAILGHHPHVLQTVETHAGKPIVYSLGNFTFGPQPVPRDASAIAELTIERSQVTSIRMIPVMLRGMAGSPEISLDERGERARERLRGNLPWTDAQGVLELGLGTR